MQLQDCAVHGRRMRYQLGYCHIHQMRRLKCLQISLTRKQMASEGFAAFW